MIFIHIVETTNAIEPEVTTIEVQIVPAPDPNDPFSAPLPPKDDHETDSDDSLQLGNNHADDDDDDDEGPAALNIKPTAPPKSKKRKVTHQDIQAMQFDVLKVEKHNSKKIAMFINNYNLFFMLNIVIL